MHNSRAIGVFDSGIGGLSIWKDIHNLLPNESTIYLADSINIPYGDKSKKEIIDLSKKNTEALIKKECKIIIVACNTATTNAISVLRSNYNLPFIGIEPATKPAAIKTITGKIGILATKGTLVSEMFSTTSKKYRGKVKIIETIGEGLVPLIESGKLDATKPFLQKYLLPMVQDGIDNLVLGCTHYSFLIPIIKEIIPSDIHIIDSGKAVAHQTKNVLSERGLLNPVNSLSINDFYTNANTDILKRFLSSITEDPFNIFNAQWQA